MTETPNCDKLDATGNRAETVEDFLRWLSEQGIVRARYEETGYHLRPDYVSAQDLTYRFLGIDGRALEAERRAVLAQLRICQCGHDPEAHRSGGPCEMCMPATDSSGWQSTCQWFRAGGNR